MEYLDLDEIEFNFGTPAWVLQKQAARMKFRRPNSIPKFPRINKSPMYGRKNMQSSYSSNLDGSQLPKNNLPKTTNHQQGASAPKVSDPIKPPKDGYKYKELPTKPDKIKTENLDTKPEVDNPTETTVPPQTNQQPQQNFASQLMNNLPMLMMMMPQGGGYAPPPPQQIPFQEEPSVFGYY